jgi:hypothetical protein
MKNNINIEMVSAGVLIILTVLLLNPFDFWMPDMLLMAMLTFTLVTFSAFATFVLRESVGDEREVLHRMLAGRVAFLTGSFLLTVGIVVQALNHSVDYWLVVALVGMVLSKLMARIYSDRKF